MILIGQFDSPFVRRVGIALTVYGMAFEHRPWSVFGNADQIRVYNPLMRVPTLVLDDGDVLVCSATIIDYLDGLVAPDCRLFPIVEPDRHRALAVAALGTGLADKAVSLFYERRLHQETSDIWVDRCRRQIDGVLEASRPDAPVRRRPTGSGACPDMPTSRWQRLSGLSPRPTRGSSPGAPTPRSPLLPREWKRCPRSRPSPSPSTRRPRDQPPTRHFRPSGECPRLE